MAQVALAVHGTCVMYLRPVDGYVMYTNFELEYHSHISTTSNPTPIMATHARRRNQCYKFTI